MSNWKMADWNLHAPEFVPGPPPQPFATSKPMDLAAQQGRGLAAGHPVLKIVFFRISKHKLCKSMISGLNPHFLHFHKRVHSFIWLELLSQHL